MPIEIKVKLSDEPGSLARLGTVLGDAEVNIDGIHGTGGDGESVVHFVTDNALEATHALDEAELDYIIREVVVLQVLDEPGTLGDVALVMSEAGVNIDSVYTTTRGDVVFGVDDVAGAIQIAAGMAVMAQSAYTIIGDEVKYENR